MWSLRARPGFVARLPRAFEHGAGESAEGPEVSADREPERPQVRAGADAAPPAGASASA
ncbi:hypothetical protein EKD16_23340 [Streptomonospora litoralis]|uniref:Uncharacterized protein n=1 Tax=Streptomonospora litoralis TaxID=2498135 RepID=A0A4P6QAS8_9ACTN|nr:hypothetical protein EKD16_23340 [Streptomonospora litoralis]